MKDKKDLKEVSKKIEEAMETLEKGLDEKVSPKIKGMEMPILIAMVVMILTGLSVKGLILGAIVLAVLLSPKYMGKVMEMIESKKSDKKVAKTDDKKVAKADDKKVSEEKETKSSNEDKKE